MISTPLPLMKVRSCGRECKVSNFLLRTSRQILYDLLPVLSFLCLALYFGPGNAFAADAPKTAEPESVKMNDEVDENEGVLPGRLSNLEAVEDMTDAMVSGPTGGKVAGGSQPEFDNMIGTGTDTNATMLEQALQSLSTSNVEGFVNSSFGRQPILDLDAASMQLDLLQNPFFSMQRLLQYIAADSDEQAPLEHLQKMAQMVQDAQNDDFAVFNPVDGRTKRFIILEEWYTTSVASTMVGRRNFDEDAMLVGAPSAVRPETRFKAVFDGHAGEQTSNFCADNIARYLGTLEEFSYTSLKDACLRLDADLIKKFGPRNVAGSTGIVVIIEKVLESTTVETVGREIMPHTDEPPLPLEQLLQMEEVIDNFHNSDRYSPVSPKATVTLSQENFILTVVNIGDSRAMLLHEGGTFTRLSKDHKPNHPVERERIEKAGGFITQFGSDVPRVDGVLALSRAFGDSDFKAANLPADKQRVVAVPDVRKFYVQPTDILLMACDGLFEPLGLDWKLVHDLAVEELKSSGSLELMTSRLMDYAYNMDSRDNISILVTAFHKEKFERPLVVYKTISGSGEVLAETHLPNEPVGSPFSSACGRPDGQQSC